MDTLDTVLGVCTAVSLAICAACVGAHAWRQSKKPTLKVSRSDNDLENILQDSLPTSRSRSTESTGDPTDLTSA